MAEKSINAKNIAPNKSNDKNEIWKKSKKSWGHIKMDQNSNVNLKVVQCDCPIKYEPKTLQKKIRIEIWALSF